MNLIELGVAAASAVVLGSVAVVGSAGVRSSAGDPLLLLDQHHIRSIHQAMVSFAGNNIDGSLPKPGRINPFTDAELGRVPGAGPENWRKDSTGHLYSAMVAQEYLDTKVLISPGERNPVVSEYGTMAQDASAEYDYSAYDPASDTYWMGDQPDPAQVSPGTQPTGAPNAIFRTKINRPPTNGRGHASYAHLMLAGQRRLDWNAKAEASRVLLGTRGTKYGDVTGNEFQKSWTLLFFGPPNVWVGNICRGDGRVERLEHGLGSPFSAPHLDFACESGIRSKDILFAAEFEACGDVVGNWRMRDAWLAMNEVVADSGGGDPRPLAIYDYLRN